MTTTYNLRASNNATFRWTRDLTPFAAVYNLSAAAIRLQARASPYAPDPPAYEWSSVNTTHGQITFSPATNLCVFVAPEADMARMRGDLVYDCRLEFSGGASVVIFGGRLCFSAGVTRLFSDLSGTGVSALGDTVAVEGERGATPVPLPLSLSAAVAACQAAQAASAASAASVTPAGLAAALASLSSAQLSALAAAMVAAAPASALSSALGAMIQALPTAPTSGVTTLWSDGGTPVFSQG
jgi:hypothetical protein